MKKIALITPCFNEGNVIEKFNDLLNDCIKSLPYMFDVIYVNDGSYDGTSQKIQGLKCQSENINICMLDLQFNVGHQGALYQGLIYANENRYDNILIMDSDGEDDPRAIEVLLEHADKDIVQVIRGKRRESFLFRVFYSLYKLVSFILIGKKINFGNYSLVRPKLVAAAVEKSFVHLAAFLDNQKCSKHRIKWDRMQRLDGNSKMDFKGLFYHGINSLTENAPNLLFFFIGLSLIIFIGILILIGIILYKKYIANVAILGWSSTLLTNLTNSLLLCIGFFVTGALQLNLLSKHNSRKKSKIYKTHTVIKNWVI